MKIKKLSIITSIVILVLFLFWFCGKLLDWEAERIVDQLYVRDQQGVIQGLQSIAIVGKNHSTALVLIHGLMDSPTVFSDIAHDVAQRTDLDVYVPLLPLHGKNLQTAAQLDNNVVNAYLQQYIANLAKKYPKLVVLGFSYGGAMLVNLAYNNKLPANVQIILCAPAVFITSNTFIGYAKAYIYALWRNYCNYPAMGCRFPSYDSGDETTKSKFDEEKSLHYNVASATLQLYKFDRENRSVINNIHRPYTVIFAADDNRVDYLQEKTACLNNKNYCRLYTFPTGRHMLYWGKNQKAFENLLIKLATQKN